jgi:hypothetical protein
MTWSVASRGGQNENKGNRQSMSRRIAAVAFALLLSFAITAAVASIAAPGADAKVKKPKVSLKITTKNQAALLKANKLTVRVKSTGRTKVKVTASSSGKKNYFKSASVSFGKKGGTRTVALAMTKEGKSKLSLCGAKSVKVEGKYSGKTARASRSLARDGSRCINVPLGAKPATCDFLDGSACLHPFPNDFYTKNDASSSTGKRLNIAADATPANKNGVHIDATDMNRGDGFSPGNKIIIKIPGLDTPAAFNNTGLVPITDLQAYDDPSQAVMVIDAETGERHPIWAELDSNPTTIDPDGPEAGGINTDPANTADVTLIVRPASNFEHGKRYIVALRNLKDASNKTIQSPNSFRTYRDRIVTTQKPVENRRSKMNGIISTLVDKAGVKRGSLYMAWDFTVASAESTTGRALEIRDDAFARLGDNNLANRVIEGNSPVVKNLTQTSPGGNVFRRIDGEIEVPCYISSAGCAPGGTFQFDANDNLTWNTNSKMDVPFRCHVPQSAVSVPNVNPTTTGTYGHGLLGSLTQIGAQNRVGNDANTTWCAVDWAGFSSLDLGSVGASLADMSNFNKMVDRMQQGFVNFMYLQRALIHPNGLATQPAFKHDAGNGITSLIDTSQGVNTRGQYMGISQGGIMGGALTALSPDADYGVLGVPGMNYSTLLRRSVDSDAYFKAVPIGLYPNYPNELERPLLLSVIQLLWDRGEANGYAHHMTTDPLPNTPPHEVLMRVAFSDHQVANVTAEVEARTAGVKVYDPALQPGRHWEQEPFMGIQKQTTFPSTDGSMMVYYDSGPTTFTGTRGIGVLTPPNENVPPRPQWGFGRDPHGDPRASESGIRHAVTFLNGPALNGNNRGTIESCAVTGAGDYFAGPAPLTPISPPAAGDKRCYANGWNGIAGLAP